MEITTVAAKRFSEKLLEWHHQHNTRSLPWKGVKDPYKIWLSEVILQQTRAMQGLPYYVLFIEKWPDINALAAAPHEEVFRAWQGLGYYSRCKNMLVTARIIATQYGGVFPAQYAHILALKGIGAYTASAIASFAFGLPHAVVDGNVYRILSRYLGIPDSIDTTQGKKLFATVATAMLHQEDSAAYNQAIMDFGATVCIPAKPGCSSCPLQEGCYAFRNNVTNSFPVRSKKLTIKTRHFGYVILECNGEIWLHKREAGDIWENLHEPYLIEHTGPVDAEFVKNELAQYQYALNGHIQHISTEKQRLTHQHIHFYFFHVRLTQKLPIAHGNWLSKKQLGKLAFPKSLFKVFDLHLLR